MQENVIEFFTDQEIATVTFTQKRFVNKIEKLAKQYPDECEIVEKNKDGSICAHFPVTWIRIFHPQVMSDEDKKKRSELMKQIRADSSATTG